MEKEILRISGCNNCPACMPNDMTSGFSCNFMKHTDNFIREDKPDWCPLITKNILNNEQHATMEMDNILKIIKQPPSFQWNVKI